MSIVRYKNKKTGAIAVYESTSHYDPATKQSRPIRKYLGIEDPVTGKLIPSSGKRGRKKASVTDDTPASTQSMPEKEQTDYKLLYEVKRRESDEKDQVIKQLERENKRLRAALQRIDDVTGSILSGKAAVSHDDE